MRTFIAIDLSPEIKQNLRALLQSLRRLKAEVRWVGEDSFHLTLKFLGEINEEEVKTIIATLEKVARQHRPFSLECRSTGCFPKKGTPRVFWVGVVPSPALLQLQQEIEVSLEKSGWPREPRAFHPHLTLGRVKSARGTDQVLKEIKKYEEQSFGQMEVGAITLFQSVLRPSGAEYHVIREVRLG